MPELSKTYDPKSSEERWYETWDREGYFRAEADPGLETFSITIPPPNVTGSLHIGHALCYTLQDVLARWKRMHGYETLCLPGMDHAGIATQNAVERDLAREGLTRHDLGREKFLERVWQWKEQYGGTIFQQFRKMGYSFDWERSRFTLDEGYHRAVTEHFVRLHEEGHIYRGERVINWCPRCSTAISDIEIEYEDREAQLYHIDYPLEGGGGHVTVATTRPETMLGDTAVAVNPKDARYTDIVGKNVVLPVMNRPLPIVADDYADPEFGTGAVKVTPAHDPNDFEIGRRHNLPSVSVIGTDAVMTEDAGKYAGKERYEARDELVRELEALGVLRKVEPYQLSVNTCARCHTVIEPLLLEQWFVRMEELAGPAMDVVKSGEVRFFPDRFSKLYLNWMESIRDWCISRQLWWGHRIPAYYCLDCNGKRIVEAETPVPGEEFSVDWGKTRVSSLKVIVAREKPEACPDCGGTRIVQDPDVLDTWFSSALWTFATMGWPDENPDLECFHPTTVLTTARDIIYLWVARMIVASMHFLNEIPFRDVYIYATVMNQEGQRMSKSLGTGVDPLELIDRYGTDALRFALVEQAGKSQDMRFSVAFECRNCGKVNSTLTPYTAQCRECGSTDVRAESARVEQARNFANKIWNASRFVLMNIDPSDVFGGLPSHEHLRVEDRWILSRLAKTIQTVNEALGSYDMDVAAHALYDFIWSEYCDWYVEMAKPRLKTDEAPAVRSILAGVLECTLRLLHPMMPFVTEEIWQALPEAARPSRAPSVMVAPYAVFDETMVNDAAEAEMAVVRDVVTRARNLRAGAGMPPSKRLPFMLAAESAQMADVVRRNEEAIKNLGRIETLEILSAAPEEGRRALTAQTAAGTLYLELGDAAGVTREIERLESEKKAAGQEMARASAKLANQGFLSKAPADVVEKQRQVVADLTARIEEIDARLALLRG